MKILVSLAIAGALAAGGIAASSTGASAGQWNGNWNKHGPYPHGPYQQHQQHQNYQSGPDIGGALVAGAFLGLAFGALASQPTYVEPVEPDTIYLPPPHPNYAAIDTHYAWCAKTYRSYNGERDSFIDFQGIERLCIDPYQQP